MAEYWRDSDKAVPSMVQDVIPDGSVGDLAVNENEVKGKLAGFGFPASREIIPGLYSKG